jgi:hypothetical protein
MQIFPRLGRIRAISFVLSQLAGPWPLAKIMGNASQQTKIQDAVKTEGLLPAA